MVNRDVINVERAAAGGCREQRYRPYELLTLVGAHRA
jgi:hypothetical protein